MTFAEAFETLMTEHGVAMYALPFIIIFTIVFGVLDNSGLFSKKDGKDNVKKPKSIYVVLSLIFAFVGTYFINESGVAAGSRLESALTGSIPVAIVFIIAVLFIVILVSSFGLEKSWLELVLGKGDDGLKMSGIFVLISVLLIVAIFLHTIGIYSFPPALGFLNTELISYLIPILTFGIVVWYVVKED